MNVSENNANVEMILNRLPSRTWNRLGINESFVTIESNTTDHKPEMLLQDPAISWDPDHGAVPGWDAIPGGVGKDMDFFTENASTGQILAMEGHCMETPLTLNFNYENGENAISRLYFHAEKNSSIQAVIMLRSNEITDHGLSALQTKLYAEEGSKIHLYIVQLLGNDFICLNDTAGICEKDAKIEITKLELGSRQAYSGVQIDLKGLRSSFQTDLGCHVQTGQKIDTNYIALHHGEKTESLMEISGTLEEGSHKAFRGTIDFQRGSRGAKGTEMENVLLLGDDMINQSIPLILCKEEDVEGNHGASIGQLDEKMLFYLGSRGISKEAAQQMISQSRIDAICNKIPDPSIAEEVHEFENQRRTLYDTGE